MHRAKTASAIGFLLITQVAVSTAGEISISVDGEPALPGELLTFDQLPAVASPDERIAAHKQALVDRLLAEAEGRQELPPLPAFVELAVDHSTQLDPEDALAMARLFLPEGAAWPGTSSDPAPESAALYERVGVALLSAARRARFDGELERAADHLLAARYVFALAEHKAVLDGEVPADGAGLIHRAIICLEEIELTGSQDAWAEAAGLLTRQLERTPTGPLADWAFRMRYHPETYAGEEDVGLESAHQVNNDVERPEKIFAPPAPYAPAARKARVQGVVIVQAVIDRHGHVTALKAIKGLPMGLTDEALRTMATWLFEPATIKGQPVVVTYFLTMRFGL